MNKAQLDRLKELVAAASEFIRARGPCVTASIHEVLEDLSVRFADRFQISDEVMEVLRLIEALWHEPDIYDPHVGGIEFVWDPEATD